MSPTPRNFLLLQAACQGPLLALGFQSLPTIKLNCPTRIVHPERSGARAPSEPGFSSLGWGSERSFCLFEADTTTCPFRSNLRTFKRSTFKRSLTPLECAVPRFRALSPLECAVTKMPPRNPFRMRSYKKRWGEGKGNMRVGPSNGLPWCSASHELARGDSLSHESPVTSRQPHNLELTTALPRQCGCCRIQSRSLSCDATQVIGLGGEEHASKQSSGAKQSRNTGSTG